MAFSFARFFICSIHTQIGAEQPILITLYVIPNRLLLLGAHYYQYFLIISIYCTVDTFNRKNDTLLTFKADEDEVLRELDALIGEGSAAAAGDDNLKLPAAPDDEPEQLDEQLPDVPAHEPAKVSLFVVTLSSTGLNMQRNTKQ